MKTPLVSIIVPLYNRRELIRRCVVSVAVQDYPHWELLIVDDGSTDAPEEVLGTLCREDARIRVMRKENGGASSARNLGLASAVGEYIMFVDSDDALAHPCVLSTMVAEAEREQADCVVAGFQLSNSETPHIVQKAAVYDFPDAAPQAMQEMVQAGILMSPVAKLTARRCVGSACFPEHVVWAEDLIFNLRMLQHCTRVVLLGESVYDVHVGTANSMSARYNDHCMEDLKAQADAYEHFLSFCRTPELERLFKRCVWMYYLSNIRCLVNNSGKPSAELRQVLRSWYREPLITRIKDADDGGSRLGRLARHPYLHTCVPLYRLIMLKQRLFSFLHRARA